jgi:hypothetical protein
MTQCVDQFPAFTNCVTALSGALLLSKQALQVEVAVAFIVFHEFGSTDLKAKKMLRTIYADAGRADCLTPDSPSYQTVTRRIGRCAAFFDYVGIRKVKKALKGFSGDAAIQVMKDYLLIYDIASMDDLAALAGNPRQPAEPKEQTERRDRRATDNPEVQHIKTRHIDLAVPPDVPPSELVSLANKLLKLAKAREATVAPA